MTLKLRVSRIGGFLSWFGGKDIIKRVNDKFSPCEGVTVTILQRNLRHGNATLGFDAPLSIPIDREEIWEKKVAEGVI